MQTLSLELLMMAHLLALSLCVCMLKDDNTGNDIFVLAVGNDRSDEKMFEAVELVSKEINTEYGFTVRIGMVPTQARFYLTEQSQMLWLLNTLCSMSPSNGRTKREPEGTHSPMTSMRSQSYSHGLATATKSTLSGTMSSDSSAPDEVVATDQEEDVVPFQRLKRVVRSIDSMMPIPPTAPAEPVGLRQYKFNKLRPPIEQRTTGQDEHHFIASPEFSGGFFDNVAVRSHSYTSLSRLERLSELNEQASTPRLGPKTAAVPVQALKM